MRVKWRGLELPTSVVLDSKNSSGTYGSLIIEPFERGFGTTVGNSLRRILLSCLEGSAVTSIRIHGAPHEFTSLPGVMEDMTEIVLNVKSLVVSLDADGPKTIRISANKAGPVVAGSIECDPSVTVLNSDLVLATLTKDVEFEMEMVVEKGRGYVPAGTGVSAPEEPEMGVVPVDGLFSPVTRVRYKTEETRVGQMINYDRLIMEIWTDGTIGPEMALVESAKILRKHLGPFVQYFELGQELAAQEPDEELDIGESEIDEELQEKLNRPIQALELSVRADNCLEMAKIETLGQLIAIPENQLLSLRSFGKTTLREVKKKLADLGLVLGFDSASLDDDEMADESEEVGEDTAEPENNQDGDDEQE